MTKENFLEQLRKELKLKNVSDIDEIIADYEEHFEFKVEEGKTEEEIVKKLASPEIIAREYAETPKQINNRRFCTFSSFCFDICLYVGFGRSSRRICIGRSYYGILPDYNLKHCRAYTFYALPSLFYNRHCVLRAQRYFGNRLYLSCTLRQAVGKSLLQMVQKHSKRQRLPLRIHAA